MPVLSIDISDEQLEVLERKALREDSSVESFLIQHVERLVLEGRDEEFRMARDPIYELRPAHRSQLTDLSIQHDHYLYGVAKR